jgi:large subunit ribosomal protein L24e
MKCSFCGETLPKGSGKMLVKNDGKIFYFCGSKCQRNMVKLRRDPKGTRWTKAFAEQKKK